MYNGPHIVYIPGEATVDIIESLKMALAKIRPRSSPIRTRAYLVAAKDKFNGLTPVARRIVGPLKHPISTTGKLIKPVPYETDIDKVRRVKRELLDAGITFYGLMKSESRTLPKVLHPNEHIDAIVYGQHHANSVMLVATDERIIYLDKKPMAMYLDEVSYEVISGIEFEIHTLFATLVLHTPVKNYDIRYANLRCAENFARHIEAHRLKRELPEKEPEIEAGFIHKTHKRKGYPNELKEDMAGYSWLPIENEEEEKHQHEQLT